MTSHKRTIALITLSQLISNLIPLITFPLLVKTFNVDEYGIWVEAGTIAGLFTVVLGYGLTYAVGALAVSQPEKADFIYSNALYLFLFLTCLLGIILVMLAPWINTFTTRSMIGISVIQILALTLISTTINQLIAQIFRLRQQPVRTLFFDVLLAACRLGSVIFAVFNRNLITFAWVYSLSQLLVIAIQLYIAYRSVHFSSIEPAILRQLLRYGGNLSLASQSEWFVMFGDRLMLSILSSSAAVAVYAASYQITLILIALGKPYLYPVLPEFGRHWKNGELQEAQKVLRKSSSGMFIVLIPAVIGLGLTGDSLLLLLATKDFSQGGLLISMISIGIVLNVLGENLQYVFHMRGEPDVLRRIYLQAALLNLVVNLFAIPLFSYNGAGFTTLLTYIFIFFRMFRRTEMPFSALFDMSVFWRCLLAAGVMGVWVALTVAPTIPRLALAVSGGALIYGIGIILLKVISLDEVLSVPRAVYARLRP
jgi:O-antigen/teichoic acid export membrane protein